MIRLDYLKYKKYGGNFISIVFLTQGFWAIFQYRIASFIFQNLKVVVLRQILLALCLLWQKVIEVTTGISISQSAQIGHSFYIGHFSGIIINARAVLGSNCNISQGVTIGVSGRGENRGVPRLGNNVYIGANSTVVGKITIGDNVIIAANSLVIKDVGPSCTVSGVPAQIVNNNDSSYYI